MNLFTRRFAAWAACLAILDVRARAVGVACTGAGAGFGHCVDGSLLGRRHQLVKADVGAKKADAPTTHDAMGQTGHCPFCSTHAASFALPPAASPAFQLTGSARMRPLLFYQSPQPLAIWTDAHSRAPPLFS